MLDPQLVEQAFEALPLLRGGQLQRLEDGEHVLLDAELAKHGRLLREVADPEPRPPVHGFLGEIVAIERDPSLVGADQTGDHVEARRLPRPVGAEQPDDLPLLEPQAHVVHHAATLVALEESGCFEHARARHALVLAADRFGPRVGVPGGLDEVADRPGAIRDDPSPHLRAERHRRLMPQPTDGQGDEPGEREARQHRRLQVGPGVVHREAAGVVHGFPPHHGAHPQEVFAIGHREPAEGGPPVVVGDTRQGGRGERQRRVAGAE